MKRSALALGASTLALALSAGPAGAVPGVNQTVNDSDLTAQVGSVNINAPIRVGSDGDNSAPAAVARNRAMTRPGPPRRARST